jgi:2-keto-3-deoxy-L-fuconate dehydrogenase
MRNLSMAGKLEGRVALVTSAGQGIGRASAIALAREGAKVFATDIREDLFKDISKEHPGITGFGLNVLEQAAVDAALKRTGPIDILFNCSGFVHNGTVLDCEEKDWDFSFDLNVKAHYRMIKAYLPGMLAKGKGNVINMASVASSVKGAPNRFVYGASKAAVIGLTKALAADFVAKGIRCNAICPGTVETPSLYDRMRAQGDFEKAKAAFIARQPMGRMAQPEEIAEMVIYLASDDSAFITGQALVIDGGWSI